VKAWDERPREIRNLFNPAFLGLILLRAIEAYQDESGKPMPFSLCLLIFCCGKHLKEDGASPSMLIY
jgi:hypothetical protein